MATIQTSVILVSLLACFLASRQTALGQAVDARAMGDKQDPSVSSTNGGGVSRTIYSQKQLSPHRMMHFGKRLLFAAPPSFFMPSPVARAPLVDLPVYQTNGQEQLDSGLISYNPTLRQPFEESPSSSSSLSVARMQVGNNRQLLEFVTNLLENNKQLRECLHDQQQQQQQLGSNLLQRNPSVKLMKLIDSSGDDSQYDQVASDLERQQPQEEKRNGNNNNNNNNAEQALQESGGQEGAINVASRSVPLDSALSGVPQLTRAHLSTILYGRRLNEAPTSLMALGNYIKKAEPQKMTFMHFG